MISAWASRITEALYASGTIEERDKEIYQYGFFLLLSRLYFFLFTVISGAIFGVTMESIIFYIMFSTLRGYAGGIHAKSESTCTLITSLTIFCSIVSIYVMQVFQAVFMPLGMLFTGTVSILIISPFESLEKPLSNEDRKLYGIASKLIAFAIVTLAIIGASFGQYKLFYCSVLSIFLEGSILVLGIMANYICSFLSIAKMHD